MILRRRRDSFSVRRGHDYFIFRFRAISDRVARPRRFTLITHRDKACKKVDVKVAQAASGMFRPLTSSNVESHLKNVGLDAEFATHHRISALSGGQKVKVVLGAAMWMQPHLVILDEPTNYLDRESLGALADAIREFEGGVVIISHNNDFTTALCPETWVVEKVSDSA